MTNSFRPQASPVDTFVSPSTVAPTTGFDQLVNALQTVNPAINKYFDSKVDTAIKEERRKGARIAFDQAKGGITNIVKSVRKTDGNEAARQLVGGNIFSNDEYNKVSAQLRGDTYKNTIEMLYQTKRYKTTTSDGQELEVPLFHFSPSSPEVQSFLQEVSNISSNLTSNLPEDYVLEYFIPDQSKAISSVITQHGKDHKTYSFNKLSKQSYGVMSSAYLLYKEGNKEAAIEKINTFNQDKVLLGITSDKEQSYFNNLLDYTKSLRAEAFSIDGIDGSNSVLEMMKKIQYGPGGKSFFETHPEFGYEMNKQTIEHMNNAEKIRDFIKKNLKIKNEDEIIKDIKNLGNDPNGIIEIGKKANRLGIDMEFVLEQVPIIEGERIQTLETFSIELTRNKYTDQPTIAVGDFLKIWNSLGPNYTDEEIIVKNRIIAKIDDNLKGKLSGINSKIDDIIIRGRKRIGNYNSLKETYEILKGEKDPTTKILDLERDFYRNYEQWLLYTDDDGDGAFESRTRKEIDEYLIRAENKLINDIRVFKGKPTYKFDTDTGNIDSSSSNVNIPGNVKSVDKNTLDNLIIGGYVDEVQENGNIVYKDKFTDTTYILNDTQQTTNQPVKNNQSNEINTTKDPLQSSNNQPKQSLISQLLPGGSPVNAGTLEDNLNIYTVKKGDDLYSIAENNSIDFNRLIEANNIKDPDLIYPGDKIIIPPPRRDVLSEFKGKPIPDFGGLAELVISGESRGHGAYNAFNKGTTDTAGTMDITSKTIAEMEQLQADGKVSAVGAYQFMPGVLAEARKYSGIEADAIMTPAVQDRLFWGMLLSGKKKAVITDYLLGENDDLRAAHEALAKEFAALEGPDGIGIHDGDKGGNLATIKAAIVKQALIKARKAISNK